MLPEIEQIILTNINVKLYSCILTFRNVMGRQIWGEVMALILSFCAVHFFKLNVEKSRKLVYISWSYHNESSQLIFETRGIIPTSGYRLSFSV